MNKLMISLFLVSMCSAVSALAEDKKPPTRTLDDITIEGAVDVPQVLFITSRGNVRFDDGLGWSFIDAAADSLTAPTLPVRFSPFIFRSEQTLSNIPVEAASASPEPKEQ